MTYRFTWFSKVLLSKVRCAISTLLLAATAVTTCLAQTTTPPPPVRNDLIPPAPTAAALGKYGDVPVSLYAGKPQISIPLGEVASGKLRLPLTLNYNAGGVRVEEIASWVGMGWSLDAGGVITRSVRGLPDEGPNGFFNKAVGAVPDPPVYSIANYSQFSAYASGQYDSQPDLYYFNVAGRSGKFVQNQDRQIQITPYQKLKIETIPGNGGGSAWQLTTEDGTRYLFKHIEYSAASSNTFGGGTNTASGGAYYASSWFLSDIISPTNERIQFQYSDYNLAAYPVASSETKYYRVGGTPGGVQTVSDNTSYNSTILYQGKHLNKILFPNGEVEFVLGLGRCDLLGDQFLQKIVFRRTAPQTQVLKEYWLDYRYSNSGALLGGSGPSDCAGMTDANNQSAQSRLFLTAVQERNGPEQKPAYQLAYWFDAGGLPPRSVISGSNAGLYYGQDHWGYSNGRTNTTLVPAMTASNGTQLAGADRSPVLSYARSGALKTITYPTGGTTAFDWELHDFVLPAGTNPIFTPPTRTVHWNYDTYPSAPALTPIVVSNTLSATTQITATVSSSFPCTCGGAGAFDISGGCHVAFLIYRKSDNQQMYAFSCKMNPSNLVYTFPLANGEYYLVTYHTIPNASPSQNAPDPARPYNISLDWVEPIVTAANATATNVGGGLRIAQITDTDPVSGQSLTKVYEYKQANGSSSGQLVSLPNYTFPYSELITLLVNPADNTTYSYRNDFVVRNSNSQAALGTTQGSPVGYAKVTVYYGQQGSTNGINGKTEYVYTSPSSNPDWQEGGTDPRFITPTYPYAPADSKDWQRGLLVAQTDYRRTGSDYFPVKAIRNTYAIYNAEDQAAPNPNVAGKYVLGVKVSFPNKAYYAENQSGWQFQDRMTNGIPPAYAFFKFRQGYSELVSTTSSLYDQYDVTKAVTATSTYAYSLANLQVQESVQTASNQDLLRTTFKYPSDFVVTNTTNTDEVTALQRMQQLNMLSSVVEKQIWSQPAGTLGWRLLQGELTKFTSLAVPTPSAPNPVTVVPAQWWTLDTPAPLLTPVTTTVSNGALTYDPAYSKKQEWSYDPATANVVSSRRANDVPTSYLWGYQQTLPIAEVKNATADQIAFTSFEADSPGGWTYDATNYVSTALTGSRGYGLGGGSAATVQRTGLPAGVY